jgi:hypothetical protein
MNLESLGQMQWQDSNIKILIPTKGTSSLLASLRQLSQTLEIYFSKPFLDPILKSLVREVNLTYIMHFNTMEIQNEIHRERVS